MKSVKTEADRKEMDEACCGDDDLIAGPGKLIRVSGRWIPGGLTVIFIVHIILGYLLDAPAIRVLWLVFWASLLVVVLPLLVLLVNKYNQCCKEIESESIK